MPIESPKTSLLLCTLCAVMICLVPVSASAQNPGVGIRQAAADAKPELSQVIDAGKALELQGRWGEALAHYQSALKMIP